MVPFAGRIRDGRFTFAGRVHQLPRNLPPHAIHGTVFDRPWRVAVDRRGQGDADDRSRSRLAVRRPGHPVDLRSAGWPGRDADARGRRARCRPGSAGTRGSGARVGDAAVDARLRRRVGCTCAGRRPADRRADRAPARGPWDDAFTGVAPPPRLRWPGVLELEIDLDRPAIWVVFDERARGHLRRAADRTARCGQPGRRRRVRSRRSRSRVAPLSASMAWRWSRQRPDGAALGLRGHALSTARRASGMLTPVTRFLPARLLVYIARSALIISSSAVWPSSGKRHDADRQRRPDRVVGQLESRAR